MTRTLLALAFATTTLFSGASQAGLVNTPWQSASTGLKGTTGAATALSFAQYNPASYGGAALKGVEFQLVAHGYAVYEVRNDQALPPSDINFRFTSDITVTVANPAGGPGLVASIPALADIARALPADEAYASPGYSPLNPLLGLTASKAGSATYAGAGLAPSLAALFTGTGSISLNTFASVLTSFNADNDYSSSLRTRYNATLQVRYSYDQGLSFDSGVSPALPEPATVLLFSTGLLGLATRRKPS